MPPKSGKGKGVKGGKKKLAAKRPREEDQQAEEEPHQQQEVEVEVEAPAAEAEADDLVVFDPTEEATADVEGDEAEAEAEAGEEDEAEGTQGTKRPKATVLERCLAGQRNKIASHSVLVHRVPRSVTQAALQAALEELLGKEEVHSVHHKPSPAAAPTATSNAVVVLRSAEGVIGALQRGKVTVDGQDFVLEPGVSTLARGVYLYGIGESVTDLEVTRLLEERVKEPGAVELVIRRKPFLPVRGGFALFRTVQLAVAASHPHKVVRAAAPESESESSEPSGVFRVSLDSIKTHNCAVFVTARPGVTELGEATVAGEVDRVFGDGSFVDMLPVAPPPKPKALVVLRVSGTIPQAIERLNQSDVKAFVTYANITGRDWATQLRIQHFPADHAPPLGDILRFYESHLPSEFTMLTGVSSVRGNTLVSFGTPGMAVRAFFLGPVVLSSGAELPVFLSQPKEANKGYHHINKNEDGRPAKQQRHDTNGGRGGGGRGGGRGRGPTSRGGTWRGGRGGRNSA